MCEISDWSQICDPPHASGACSTAGACIIGSCEAGWADCDGNPTNGCEADLLNASTCGACATQCPTGTFCSSTGCVAACQPTETIIGTSCRDILTDPTICGGSTSCAASHGAYAACSAGKCGYACKPGYVAAGGECVDVETDIFTCGMYGIQCQAPVGGMSWCQNGTCGAACSLPWLTDCAGKCVLTELDPANCGTCGNACASGQTCSGGTCIPQSAVFLAPAGSKLADIAVDGQNVYWTDTGNLTVSAVPKGGGTVTVLGSGQPQPTRLALDDTYVYWSNYLGGTIMRAPKDGSAAPTLVSLASSPSGLVVIGSYVYFVDANGLEKVPSAGGSPAVWTNLSGLVTPPYGGSATYNPGGDLVTDGSGTTLWVGGKYSYTPYYMGYYTGDSGAGVGLARVDVASGTVGAVQFLRDGASSLAVDATYVYVSIGWQGSYLSWLNKSSLSGGGTTYAFANGIVGGSCGVVFNGYAGTDAASNVSLWYHSFAPAQDTKLTPVAQGTASGRMVSDGSFLYWLDSNGIGKLPAP